MCFNADLGIILTICICKFVLYHEDWPRLPDSSELSDALLKSVFDDESDALMRAYLENRGVSNLESTDEDDHTWR